MMRKLVAVLFGLSLLAPGMSQAFDLNSFLGGGDNVTCGQSADKPLKVQGRRWEVIAAFNGVPIYESCRGNKTSGQPANFRQSYYVAAEENGRLLLVQYDLRKRQITDVVGWADKNSFVLGREARRPEGKLAYRKALIVNKGREEGGRGEFREVNAYGRPSPAKGEEPTNKLGVFQIYYVFTPPGMEDGDYELLGLVHALPSMRNARELLGWVPKKRILYWPHRQALEINKDKDALTERQQAHKPALAFSSPEKLQELYRKDLGKGVKIPVENREAMKDMGIIAVERLSFDQPWPPYVNRWPILDTQAQPERQFGLNVYRVGVIGDIELRDEAHPTTQQEAQARIAKEEFYRQQAKIQEILSLYQNVDILFLVDLTSSIRPFLGSISEGINEAMQELRTRFAGSDFQPKVRFAIAGYRDEKDKVPFEWVSKTTVGGTVNHFHQDIGFLEKRLNAAAKTAHSAIARHPENTMGALLQAVKEAKFKEPHSYRAVFVIGDAGSVGDPLDQSAACSDCRTSRNVEKEIAKVLKERRVKMFPIQVRSRWMDQRNADHKMAADLFEHQAKYLKELNGNWVSDRQEVANDKKQITDNVVANVFTTNRESTLAQCVLQQVAQGNNLDYVMKHPEVCGGPVAPPAGKTAVAEKAKASSGKVDDSNLMYGVVLMVGDVIRQMIRDDNYIRKNRIQAFDTGYILQRHPELKHDYVKPVVLMSLPDLQKLVGILAHVTDHPLRPRDLGRIWKAAIASELGDEARYQADSYYAAMDMLDIPVQSDILRRPFADFNEDSGGLSEEELDKMYAMLRKKWELLSNIFQGGKKNFFTIYQRDYTWIPVELLP